MQFYYGNFLTEISNLSMVELQKYKNCMVCTSLPQNGDGGISAGEGQKILILEESLYYWRGSFTREGRGFSDKI